MIFLSKQVVFKSCQLGVHNLTFLPKGVLFPVKFRGSILSKFFVILYLHLTMTLNDMTDGSEGIHYS